jgi:hypothetical protein
MAEAQNAVERQNTNERIPCASFYLSKQIILSTSISRSIDYRIDPHVHARESLSVRMVASAAAATAAGTVMVSVVCARTSRPITSSISIIISFQVIAEAESAVVSLVRTCIRPVL